MTPLSGWQNFYVIVGSAAGALIGLQFVVMTLIADRPPHRAQEAIAAFGTPTIVHFGAELALSGILSAPWDAIAAPGSSLGVRGTRGVVYTVLVTRRMRAQAAYRPQFEDWQ